MNGLMLFGKREYFLFLCFIFSIFCSPPFHAEASSVYITSTSVASVDNTIRDFLLNFGHEKVDIGVQYSQLNGTQSFAGYDAVLLLNNYNWASGGMPVAGQTAILNYVKSGHGLVTGEWILWQLNSDFSHRVLDVAFPQSITVTPTIRRSLMPKSDMIRLYITTCPLRLLFLPRKLRAQNLLLFLKTGPLFFITCQIFLMQASSAASWDGITRGGGLSISVR